MDWWGSFFRGFSPTLQKSRTFNNNACSNYQIRPYLAQLGIAMPRNKVSNDIDHVRKDPQPENAPKESPPKPKPLPKYKPIQIKKPFTHGHALLPDTTSNNPYAIFSLFFTESILERLVQHTNEYAFLFPRPKIPHSRAWIPTTISEFRAFIGVSI